MDQNQSCFNLIIAPLWVLVKEVSFLNLYSVVGTVLSIQLNQLNSAKENTHSVTRFNQCLYKINCKISVTSYC